MRFSAFMLDIETLGTSPSAAITQIGICPFDLHTLTLGNPKSYRVVPHKDSVIDFATVTWWMEQDDAARRSVFSGERLHPSQVLQDMGAYIRAVAENDYLVWAMPPSFDIVILETLYRQTGFPPPWKYNGTRCLRTLLDVRGFAKEDRCKPAIPHDAGSDAEAQARTAIYSEIMQDREHRYVECMIAAGGFRQWRQVDHVEAQDDAPPKVFPFTRGAEEVHWMVGDTRPWIYEGAL